MPITELQLEQCIREAGFPFNKRKFAFEVVSAGLESFRDHRHRRYYGVRGKPVKKPSSAHATTKGRHCQDRARFVLIAALYRAWLRSFGTPPTLNHRGNLDTPFATFAIAVMDREGIRSTHDHLENYWSYSKAVVALQDGRAVKWRISWGTKYGP